ncbi:hypothetical protein ILYODFUR_028474, partial [Ilyodon furcidens]
GCPAHPDRPHSRQAPPRSPLSISEQQKQVEDPSREVKKVSNNLLTSSAVI